MHESERVSKPFASLKRSKRCVKMIKYTKIHENLRKSSISSLQQSSKKHVWSTSTYRFAKKREFHIRNASEHVTVTLCAKRRNFMHFHTKIDQIHSKFIKMYAFRSHLPPWSVQNDAQKWWNTRKSMKIVENPRSVAYKNHQKITFGAHPRNALQKSENFTSGTLLSTLR